ncbi:hypothetical protein M0Q50_07340 [bacterium]|jgi:hypothetical protein|nr:hypothetical protein [bacterium]
MTHIINRDIDDNHLLDDCLGFISNNAEFSEFELRYSSQRIIKIGSYACKKYCNNNLDPNNLANELSVECKYLNNKDRLKKLNTL